MAENKRVKTTPFPDSALMPAGKPLYGQTDNVDPWGNVWVRTAGQAPGKVTDADEANLLAAVDQHDFVRLVRVNDIGLRGASDEKIDLILATLTKILFVLSEGLNVASPSDLDLALTKVA